MVCIAWEYHHYYISIDWFSLNAANWCPHKYSHGLMPISPYCSCFYFSKVEEDSIHYLLEMQHHCLILYLPEVPQYSSPNEPNTHKTLSIILQLGIRHPHNNHLTHIRIISDSNHLNLFLYLAFYSLSIQSIWSLEDANTGTSRLNCIHLASIVDYSNEVGGGCCPLVRGKEYQKNGNSPSFAFSLFPPCFLSHSHLWTIGKLSISHHLRNYFTPQTPSMIVSTITNFESEWAHLLYPGSI